MAKKNGSAKKIVIVGAGPGGLASAMLLAHRGFDVTVFEKEAVIGGRTARLTLGDYHFDLGPTFLMMKYLLDELFENVGKSTETYLDCPRLDPMYRLVFKRGELPVSGNRVEMKRSIEKIFPGESEGVDRFYERESSRFEYLYPCLQKDYGSLKAFVSATLVKALPHLAAGRSLYDVMSDYFKSEELRLAFTFQSKYLGMSPWDCPGLFSMIPYTEHAHGVYHVKGGLAEIPRAFAKAAEEFGAKIEVNAPVEKVLVKNGKAIGVQLSDGRSVMADDVVVNADFGMAVEKLFPKKESNKWKPERVNKLSYSCSTFMLYLGVDKLYPADHHAIYFADDYKENLLDISERKKLSKDVSIYVRNASINDSTIAPAGHSALYVLVPVPNNDSGIDWNKEKAAFRELILDRLEKVSPYKDLRSHIVQERMITPLDWQEQGEVYKGATFNMGHNLSQLLYFRPHNKFEDFDNCYLVGGGTHPGSGLPTIFESARIAANLISKEHSFPYRAPKPLNMDELERVHGSH